MKGCLKIWTLILLAAVAAAGFAEEPKPLLVAGRTYSPPFSSEESLSYEVYWKPAFLFPAFKAGEIRLQLDQTEYEGRPTFRIRAWANSDGALLRVAGIQVRNYFESEIDRTNFRSYHHLQNLEEGKRRRHLELRFDYDQGKTWVRETDPSVEPPRVLKDLTRPGIPAPVVDVLSAFYVTRLRPFKTGELLSFQLNDRGEFQQVIGLAVGKEKVPTPIGDFTSMKLTTRGGLFRDGGDFRIWFSDDTYRIPTRFEADVKFGKVYGSLVRIETPRYSRGLVRVP